MKLVLSVLIAVEFAAIRKTSLVLAPTNALSRISGTQRQFLTEFR